MNDANLIETKSLLNVPVIEERNCYIIVTEAIRNLSTMPVTKESIQEVRSLMDRLDVAVDELYKAMENH